MLSRASVRAFSSSSVAAIKVSARDAPSSSLSSLSVVVNNAGSKSGKSGVAHLLSKFNFLNTETKSALRFTRESELLGGVFSTNVTRDAIVLNTQFLKEDLPYYVEALGNVLAKPSFRPFEFPETVLPVAKAEYETASSDATFTALESLHELSFRKGYGQPLYYDGSRPISLDEVKQFADDVYTSSNVSVFASGVNEADLQSFISQSAFSSLKEGSSSSSSAPASFVGKESRVRSSGKSVAIIGVPVNASEFSTYESLSTSIGSSALPSSASPLALLPGAATSQLLKYQDAGLFYVAVSDADPSVVASSIKAAKKILTSVTASDLAKSAKSTKLSLALQSTFESPLDIKVEASPKADFSFKAASFNYVAVGDIDVLPYADEL